MELLWAKKPENSEAVLNITLKKPSLMRYRIMFNRIQNSYRFCILFYQAFLCKTTIKRIKLLDWVKDDLVKNGLFSRTEVQREGLLLIAEVRTTVAEVIFRSN